MDIFTSPDISKLQVQILYDISGTLPQIIFTNQSTGSNLAGCTWAFNVLSPSQTVIINGDINDPIITGDWAAYTDNSAWPRPFNQIEYSGANYLFTVTVKDSVGNVYVAPVQATPICRPVGNSQSSKNTYGLASSDVKVQCQDAAIFFQDTTYHTYQGESGDQYSSVLRVIYPIDETLVIPDPFIAAQYVTALVPISYSSKNYQFVQTVIYDYEVGDNSIVRIRYQTIQTFGVFCNIDLLPLVCEINKLLDTVESGNCSDITEAQRKMNLIVGKFALVMIGIQQPLTGVDVPVLIDEIIAIGGFVDCNCCTAPTGIIPTTSSVIGGYNFLFNKLGGDVAGSWSTNGQNITLNLSDVTYVVAIGSQSPAELTAFSVSSVVSGSGYLKTYYINIDGSQLAFDILNIIKGNTALINLFNSIVQVNPGGWQLIVDLDCIGGSSSACDYTFTLSGISDAPTFSYVAQIQSSVPANTRIINFAFNLSTLSQLQAYLNTLGIGTFVVTNGGGGTVLITTATNNYSLTGLVYSASGGNKTFALFSSDCTGIVALSANQVVQAIIDYLCGLTDCQLVTCQDYVICSINPTTNTKVLTTVDAGTRENLFLAQLLDGICNTVDYVLAQSGFNCASVKSLFVANSALVMQNNDIILGTKVGQCSGLSPVELFTRMMQLAQYNTDAVTAFCNLVAQCAGGFVCEPYEIFQVDEVDTSPSSDNMNIVITFSHPSAISNTIRYARIDNTSTPTYITIPNVLPGDSPYTISGVADGQYFVGITPIYSDGRACAEVTEVTPLCPIITAFSAIIDGSGDIIISYTADMDVPDVEVIINYPNGGQASTIYSNTGTDITITPPEGVIGDYFITMRPVCNDATGFKGTPTAPVVLPVTPNSNSSLTNNTSNTLSPISMIAYSISLGQYVTAFNSSGVAGSGGVISFYLADGNYQKVKITFPTGTVGGAYLIADSGTYVFVVSESEITLEDLFTSSGGVQIVLIDPSP